MAVLKYCIRQDVRTMFPEHCLVMKRFFDKALAAFWKKCRTEGTDVEGFLAKHKALAAMVLEPEVLEVVVAALQKKKIYAAASEVEKLVNGSKMGKALLSEKWSQVRGQQFSKEVFSCLKSLGALSPATLAVALPGTRQQLAELASAAGQPAKKPTNKCPQDDYLLLAPLLNFC